MKTIFKKSIIQTWVVDKLIEIKVAGSCVIATGLAAEGDVARAKGFRINRRVVPKQRRYQDTLLFQVSHEELQTNQSEDTEAEHRQDHDISKLLH